MHYLVTSFIAILRHVSHADIPCDAATKIKDLFCDEFAMIHFELAICAFEATHRLEFGPALWKRLNPMELDVSIEDFIETYLDKKEHRDDLFVTDRFLMFWNALEDYYEDQEEDEVFEDE